MLNENAKKWVAALRSGKYQQGKEALATDDAYCCLGIACLVAEQSGLSFEWRGRYYLPSGVMEWLGLATNSGDYRNATGVKKCLAFQNDMENFDFQAIADVIESDPQGLFVAARASEKGE